MDSIRAVMPRTAAKGQDNGEDPANANLEALREFVKSMQSKTMSRVWRGRRTGIMIDDSQAAKDADGIDNIDSFWVTAQIEADTASTPGGSSSQGGSTPSPGASPTANSPGTAESTSWVGIGALEAAGGDDSEGTDNEAAAEEGESRMPAKRLDYRLPRKSPVAARSEVSTDEELMAEGTARIGKGGGGGKLGGERANGNRSDAVGDQDDDDDTETDGDQQHQDHQQEQQEHQQRQEEHHEKQKQQQQQQEQEQRQLQQQQQQNTQQKTQQQITQQETQQQVTQQETQQQQQQQQITQQETQQQQQQQKKQQQRQQQQQEQLQEPGGASGGTTPADAADAAAGGKGGESTPKRNHGSARAVRDRSGSARGRGKGRGVASPTAATATSVAGTAATQAAGKATKTPARMSTGGVKDDGIASEAVGTRSGGKGWRKQVRHDSSSDDDDDDDGGGGGGGPWSFDMEEDEGRDADGSADRAPRPKSVSPRGVVKRSTPMQSPRSSSRSSPRTKLPSSRGSSVGVASASSTHRKSVDSDGSSPFPSPRRSRGRGGDSVSPPGGGSTTRSSGGSSRKGRQTKHKPASPPPSTVKRKGKGKGASGDKDREEEDDDKEEKEAEGSAAGGEGGAGDEGERGDVFNYDGGIDDHNGGVGESSSGDIGGVEGSESEGRSSSPLIRGASKAKWRAQSRNAEETGEAKEEAANKKKRKDNDRLSGGAGAKKSGARGKRGRALRSLKSPRSEAGPRFVAFSAVSERSNTPGTRRSARHRVAPIKFWKGDNIQYRVDEEGLPVAEGIVRGAGPSTPGLPKKRLKSAGGQKGRKRARELKPISPMKASQLAALPKGKYLEKEEECVVWDEETATNMPRHVVMRATNMANHTLAATLDRPPGKEKVGAAAQAFNVPGEVGISEWLSGRLVVPEGAIKDSEHVAYSTQIYVVAEGQPNALELAIAMPNKKLKSQSNSNSSSNIFDPKTAQRFLLSPGDHFFVPVNNIYRLENHSETSQAVIYWTILKSSGS